MEFIPFTPYNDEYRDVWNTAYGSWKTNLARLMSATKDEGFLQLWSPSLFRFAQQVWDAHLDGQKVDVFLLQSLFRIFVHRSTLAPFDPEAPWTLFTVVYAQSNPAQVRQAVKNHDLTQIAQELIGTLKELFQSEMNEKDLKLAHILTRALDAIVIAMDTRPELDTLIASWYSSLVPVLCRLVESDPLLDSYAYETKQCLVSLWSSAAEGFFFRPLGYSLHPFEKIGEPMDRDGAIERLSQWIGTSEIRPSSALVDAPLIMDWEHLYSITSKLEAINTTLYGGQDEMLQILQMQMEQVRDTLINLESWAPPEIPEEDMDVLLDYVYKTVGRYTYSQSYLMYLFEECNHDLAQLQQRIVPQTNILAQRKNVYDNDAFDVFADGHRLDPDMVYQGKKDKGDASRLLDDSSVDKDKVMSRVKDMYEDEEEEAIESAVLSQEGAKHADPGIQHESYLVHLFASTPDVLSRNATARKSPKREEIKQHTGMSDEQIEGWAIMFGRNPRKQRILDKYMLFDGIQSQLPKKGSTTATPKKSAPKDRSSKEKNKATVGNHNRKNMRDKKLSKAGPPPT